MDYLRGILHRWKQRHPPAAPQSGQPGSVLIRFISRHKVLSSIAALVFLVPLAVLAYYYQQYARRIDERLGSGSLRTNSAIYGAPRLLSDGDALTAQELIVRLQRAGYTEQPVNKLGYYRLTGEGLEITSGAESYFQPHTVLVQFKDGRVARMFSRTENRETKQYWMEPELITNVLDASRSKRLPVPYSELPPHLVHAIVSVEDKRFFSHSGLDFIRIAGAAYVDLREGRKEQGASTVTMQLARSFWLEQDKNWNRKIAEVLLAAELERRFTKEEILQLYANEVYLGRSGSFSVHGFGEAARAYFGKDVRKLSVPEAATLAGIIQRPSYYNPFRYPERVKERRDLVLTLMHGNGYLDARQLKEATAAPIVVRSGDIESTDAPYFVDLVNDELQGRFQDWDFAQNAYRIYSTLDMDLQRAAIEAVKVAMPMVDKQVRRGKKNPTVPQVALVALDAHTGGIKAIIGGRDYDKSQLNRVLAKRQPGSAFKPFVYAAALNLTARGKANVTAATAYMDEPTTFMFNKQPYEPSNFGDRYLGGVTVRKALMLSLNIPTIKVAKDVGFQPVVDVARAAGILSPLQATPSLALGSYEIPPVEIAEAYTIFSNQGMHVKRHWMSSIRDGANRQVYVHKPEANQVLDRRVAWLMTNMMEDVIRAGTAASVRSRGFTVPAAGKTGTARDGWFAGYTSNLLAVVWIGFDDYADLDLEGSKSALLVWTEFMKRAHALRTYSDTKPFPAPEGLVKVNVDTTTGLVAGEECLNVRTEYFIPGTQPKTPCGDHEDEDIFESLTSESADRERPKQNVVGRIMDIFR